MIRIQPARGGKQEKKKRKKREERKPKHNTETENIVQWEVISFKNSNQNNHWHIMHLNKYFANVYGSWGTNYSQPRTVDNGKIKISRGGKK